MRPERVAQQRSNAKCARPGGRLVVLRAGRPLEPAADTRIDVNPDLAAAVKGSSEPRDHFRPDFRIVLGEVHDERATDARHQIERRLDPGAAIDDGAVDPGLGGGEIGEPAATAEAERADFAGTFTAPAQRRYRRSDAGLVDFCFGTQHDIAFGSVVVGDCLLILIGPRQ